MTETCYWTRKSAQTAIKKQRCTENMDLIHVTHQHLSLKVVWGGLHLPCESWWQLQISHEPENNVYPSPCAQTCKTGRRWSGTVFALPSKRTGRAASLTGIYPVFQPDFFCFWSRTLKICTVQQIFLFHQKPLAGIKSATVPWNYGTLKLCKL